MKAISSYFPKSYKRFIDETVSIINALLIIFLIRTFIFGLYQVPSGSMETALLVGESLVYDDGRKSRCPVDVVELAAREHCCGQCAEVARADCHRGNRWRVLRVDEPVVSELVRAAPGHATRGRQTD